ncbi:PepSY-associated TM helix domain-containing protein [Oxalobacteraceae bacterium R-40]|uniref:PepSY-associated TM helix domain-containing protein n=1 Tax=Keguizhuia sedimenti TaxID=3064264 RepID=A0ABU1BVF9_9BURK|nr:PepSY-associated TM helix domain-containing protein [Oxalobacteraceae bacterium R-40]
MRSLFVLLHRYAGLAIAAFLFISGVTGAIISWDHELDELLNPHLTEARTKGPSMPALQLARLVEERHPQVQVTFLPMHTEEGHSLAIGVSPRVNPSTGKLYEPGYNQVFVDPVSGEELGKREWGSVWPITTENLVSFLYVLHFSLHLPEMWGIDRWGIWLLGVIAIIWTIDCFTGFYLTLPGRRRANGAPSEAAGAGVSGSEKSWWQRWKPAWKVRWRGGAYKLNFDLHRAFSLWTWGLLFIVAFTAFSLNLYREVFFPLMSTVSKVTPSPFDLRAPTGPHEPMVPKLTYAEAIQRAQASAAQRGWTNPVGSVFYAENWGIYGVEFWEPGEDHGVGGVGHARIYVDGKDGGLLGERQPWTGTAADIFVQAQFPLHSGRILGIPGRILISLMGLVVAMLSVTGVYIWWKKRRSRLAATVRSVEAMTQKPFKLPA